jgi:hypothetical protein
LRAYRKPATTPAIGALTSMPSSRTSNGSGGVSAFPTAIRSSHHRRLRHPRSASVVMPSDASAFGEPNRRLAPPTSRMPVMDAWLSAARDRLAEAAGSSPEDLALSPDIEATLLDLARFAAHESGARSNAPLLCYLLGRAGSAAELTRLAGAVSNVTP